MQRARASSFLRAELPPTVRVISGRLQRWLSLDCCEFHDARVIASRVINFLGGGLGVLGCSILSIKQRFAYFSARG